MRFKKWGMAGLAVVTTGALAFGVASSAGVASAQTPPGGPGQGLQRGFDRFAEMLGVTPQQWQQADQNGKLAIINQALAAGKINQQQATRLTNMVNHMGQLPQFNPNNQNGPNNRQGKNHHGPTFQNGQGFRGFGGMNGFDPLATLAGSMGMTKDDLQAQLKSGKTLAQVGADHGRTPESLAGTLVEQLRGNLQSQVTAGKLTQSQMDRFLQGAQRMFLNMINGQHNGFGADHNWRQGGNNARPNAPTKPQGYPQGPLGGMQHS